MLSELLLIIISLFGINIISKKYIKVDMYKIFKDGLKELPNAIKKIIERYKSLK